LQERLQKIIARAGLASRRQAEQLILAGEVTVNGKIVTELGSKADPERDHIKVAGRRLRGPAEKKYLLLHKPPACVATMNDPEGRPTLRPLLAGAGAGVFPVGRMDYHSSGLLLVTSDGELAARMLRLSDRLPQTWWLKTRGPLDAATLDAVERTAGVRPQPVGRRGAPNPWYEVTVTGARRDRVRRRLELLHHRVEKLKRVKLDGLELASLAPGRWRELTGGELRVLEGALRYAEISPAGVPAPPPAARPRKRRRPARLRKP
jgi:23S rRNA pseudouridine2605 synthase